VPPVKLVFFRDRGGSVPVLDWLDTLDGRARRKCWVRLSRVRQHGHTLRRPEVGYLGEGIYELRVLRAGQRIRILYGFGRHDRIVLLSAFIKTQARVPTREIMLAKRRLDLYDRDPDLHGVTE